MITHNFTQSDQAFHKKIVAKYQKGENNCYRFPIMIFFKSMEAVISQKINFKVLIQLSMINHIGSPIFEKMAYWLRSRNSKGRFTSTPDMLKNIQDINTTVQFQYLVNPNILSEKYIYIDKKPIMSAIFSFDIVQMNTRKSNVHFPGLQTLRMSYREHGDISHENKNYNALLKSTNVWYSNVLTNNDYQNRTNIGIQQIFHPGKSAILDSGLLSKFSEIQTVSGRSYNTSHITLYNPKILGTFNKQIRITVNFSSNNIREYNSGYEKISPLCSRESPNKNTTISYLPQIFYNVQLSGDMINNSHQSYQNSIQKYFIQTACNTIHRKKEATFMTIRLENGNVFSYQAKQYPSFINRNEQEYHSQFEKKSFEVLPAGNVFLNYDKQDLKPGIYWQNLNVQIRGIRNLKTLFTHSLYNPNNNNTIWKYNSQHSHPGRNITLNTGKHFNTQTDYNVSLGSELVKLNLSRYGNRMIKNDNFVLGISGGSSAIHIENMAGYQNLVVNGSLTHTWHTNLLLKSKYPIPDRSVDNPFHNREVYINQMKNNNYQFTSGSNPVSQKSSHFFRMDNENLIYHKQDTVEQQVDELKKIIDDTKKDLIEKSVPIHHSEVKKHLDINNISDQVCRNIERRIKIEKERRGR